MSTQPPAGGDHERSFFDPNDAEQAAALAGFHSRLQTVRANIAQAQARSDFVGTVKLIGVSKLQPLPALRLARLAGLADFGENYAQEMVQKREAVAHDPDFAAVTWHFIGKLQRNKVKQVVGQALIHSVDRLELLQAIDRRAADCGTEQACLVEVNWGEQQKAGVVEGELARILDGFARCSHSHCIGLMTIPPVDEPEQTRRYFAALRQLRDVQAQQVRPRVDLRELSMGMSADYVQAVLEGATMVRVGSAIFGPRPT